MLINPENFPIVITAASSLVEKVHPAERLQGVYTMDDGTVVNEESVVLTGELIDFMTIMDQSFEDGEESVLYVRENGSAVLIFANDTKQDIGNLTMVDEKPTTDHSYDPVAHKWWVCK